MTEMIGAWELDSVQNVDALELLRGLPDGSVNCVVSSPPYFGLRSYTDGDEREIGKEETPQAYVDALVEVFREARRVLRDDGVFWLNLGDSYSAGGRGSSDHHRQKIGAATASAQALGRKSTPGISDKNLLMIPHRVALALQADGWIVRQDNVWSKPNAMPESVTDRTTRAHEYVFMLVKSARYWYDAEAVKEDAVGTGDGDFSRAYAEAQPGHGSFDLRRDKQSKLGKRTYTGFNARWDARAEPLTRRNKRSVWTEPTRAFPGAHFAVMPEALVEPCVLAGCPVGGVVLDPFGGAGTVAVVARRLKRHFITCDINPEYVALARERLRMPFEKHHVTPNCDVSDLPLFAQE